MTALARLGSSWLRLSTTTGASSMARQSHGPVRRAKRSTSVPEQPPSRKNHRDAVLVRGGDNLGVHPGDGRPGEVQSLASEAFFTASSDASTRLTGEGARLLTTFQFAPGIP